MVNHMLDDYVDALKEFFFPLLGIGMVFLAILVTCVIPANAIADWGMHRWNLMGSLLGLLYMVVWFAAVVCLVKWLENH